MNNNYNNKEFIFSTTNKKRREFIYMSAISILSTFLNNILSGCSLSSSNVLPPPKVLNHNNERIIIIGSGITGLCLGAILSKIGYKVDILEAHPSQIGGHARSFDINGLIFCAGPQYVWDFGCDTSQIGYKVLKFLGIEKDNPFDLMDTKAFDNFHISGNSPLSIPMGLDKFQDTIKKKFPEEEENVDKFFYHIKIIYKGTRYLFERGLYSESLSSMKKSLLFASDFSLREKYYLYKFASWVLSDLFDFCDMSPPLRQIIYSNGGLFLEDDRHVSLGIYAAGVGSYHSGSYFPRYGFKHLIDDIVELIIKNGGNIYNNKKVTKINLQNNRITELICEDGDIFNPHTVISCVAPRLICRLIESCEESDFSYSPSNSVCTAYIGLSNYPLIHNLLKRKNWWWQEDSSPINFTSPNMMDKPKMLYITSPTANGYGYTRTVDPTRQSLIGFIPGNFSQSKMFFDKGDKYYNDFKKNIEVHIVETLEKILFPELSKYIDFVNVVTPWDTYQETNAENGNAYGRRFDLKNIFRKVRTIDNAKNLYIACATTGIAGIATAFQTSRIISEEISGIKIDSYLT